MTGEDEAQNSEVFRDCLSATLIEKLAPSIPTKPKKRGAKGRKNESGSGPTLIQVEDAPNDAAELTDFVEVDYHFRTIAPDPKLNPQLCSM